MNNDASPTQSTCQLTSPTGPSEAIDENDSNLADREEKENGPLEEATSASVPTAPNDEDTLLQPAANEDGGECELHGVASRSKEEEREKEESANVIDTPTSSDEATSELSNEKAGATNDESISSILITTSRHDVDADETNLVVSQLQDHQEDVQVDESPIDVGEQVKHAFEEMPTIAENSAAVEEELVVVHEADEINSPDNEKTEPSDLDHILEMLERKKVEEKTLSLKEAPVVDTNYAAPADTPSPFADGTPAFVNHGLQLWETSRKEWLRHNSGDSSQSSKAVATPLDVDEIIDIIFTSPKQVREDGGHRIFPQAVPLPQMIDILVDLWEAEGLDM